MYYLLTCQDIDELRLQRGGPGSPVAATIMGVDYPLDETYSVYSWEPYSTLTDNPPEVIHPTDPDTGLPDTRAGRWTKVDLGVPPQINSDWDATSGITKILNKPSLATVATSGSYSDLSGKPTIPSAAVASSGSYNDLGDKPTIQAIQRIRVQTNSTGDYTWTFPSSYGSGVIPVIGAVSESTSSTIPQGVQIVSISNTSVTVKVMNLPSTSVLGVVVLGAPAGAQAYVHLTAVAP